MHDLQLFILCAIIALVAWQVLVLVRAFVVFAIRSKALHTDHMGMYFCLPTFHEMVHELRYWHLWTFKGWCQWVIEKGDSDEN